uniref:Immunoglobulin V-set domain-containing protein n=1 Tax=Paramormyrops kingsleyae TaxID=1676925 RepID=A0A3B3T0P8_9TELE
MFILYYYIFLMLRHSCSLPIDGQSVRTESWVSAPRGGSVTIPCYYDQNSKDKTKYLCRGYEWDSCTRIAQSDGEQSRGTVDSPLAMNNVSITDDPQNLVFIGTIADDPDNLVFLVTMTNLQQSDWGHYWCSVAEGRTKETSVSLFFLVTPSKLI